MENKIETENVKGSFKIFLPKSGELECYKNLKKGLIKLLYMIEEENKGSEGFSIKLWFYSFMLDLVSSNELCQNKLTKVVVKINSLYQKDHYKEMTHQQIKRQIFESKGILDFLIKQLEDEGIICVTTSEEYQ